MIFDLGLKVEDFDLGALFETDGLIAAAVAAMGCPFCKGRLHVANYQRKPRGGAILGILDEKLSLRHSLCCGRRGCRRRVLPPSLRFLGRRVYLEMVVVLCCLATAIPVTARGAARATGVSARTLGRWFQWWSDAVPQAPWWKELRSRLEPPGPDESQLPRSLVAHLGGLVGGTKLGALIAQCLAPATTWLGDAAGFVRAASAMGIAG